MSTLYRNVSSLSQTAAPNPQVPLRRFDVFAEWNRLLRIASAFPHGRGSSRLRPGRGQSRRQPEVRQYSSAEVKQWKQQARTGEMRGAWWQKLGSDEEFQSKIISRMGERFYRQAFAPAIEQAWQAGKRYEDIRDTLREQWNPAPPGARRGA